jgi:hypothetical protein
MFRVRYQRPNKYNAKKTLCRDHWHPSKLEARVCGELYLRKLANDIKDFERQKRVRLEIDGCYIGTCIPDFYVTHNDGSVEFVEAKGMELPKWTKDWRILQHMYKDDPTVKFSVIKR